MIFLQEAKSQAKKQARPQIFKQNHEGEADDDIKLIVCSAQDTVVAKT